MAINSDEFFFDPADVKYPSVACVENACQIMLGILPRCDNPLLLRSEHPVGSLI